MNLDHLQLRTLTDAVKKELDNDLTIEEISQSIQYINSGVPGPDGLPMEFYKTFKETFLIPLLNMYKESYQNETPPTTLTLAMITVILKPGKPPMQCSSFRPISLIGVDTKILCKILARSKVRSLYPKSSP